MAQPVIQTSFNSGEWAPALYARVDLAKYHSGAALIRNWFVDYRGGATTRPGSRYILKTRSNSTVRIIPFQASLGVTYVLEFGAGYIRFYNNGAPVLENAKTIGSVTVASPVVFTITAHGYSNGDWLFAQSFGGIVGGFNGSYFIVANATANTFTLTDLFGNAINATIFSGYTSGGQFQRIFTLLNSPYQSADLFQIKFAQNVNTLILCHPNYQPYQLILNSTLTQPNWTLAPITFGATINPPGIPGTNLNPQSGGTQAWVAYLATSVDINGQESNPTPPIIVAGLFFGVNYTITLSITPPAGSVSTNIYKSIVSISGTPPGGTQYGFAGNVLGSAFIDTNIAPNFAIGPPVPKSPFSGSGIASLELLAQGANYTSVPSVSFAGGSPSAPAQASATLYSSFVQLASGGANYSVGQLVNGPLGLQIQVTAVGGGNTITNFNVVTPAVLGGGAGAATPTNPVSTTLGNGTTGSGATLNLNYSVFFLTLIYSGAGYSGAPGVSINGGGLGAGSATAIAFLGASSGGNPTVPAITQQRLFLGGQAQAPAQFNLSQPGAYYNFNTTFPEQADNAILASLNGVTLNTIKSAVAVSAGLVIFSDKGAWLLNGGSAGSAISAVQLVANPQAYSGSSDLPPIVGPNDILYVQSKGSIVRDLAYNFYLANYVGADISVLSSHLFYTFTMREWCWAEEPFKVVWVVRNDGAMLSLTFVKEQELIAWAQHTTAGSYISTCTVPESTSTAGIVDAVYQVVQRNIQGQQINYIERFVELTYPNDYISSWQVDAGIGYNGAAATTFSGAQHLGGQVVTGLADGVVINFTIPTSGTFVFGPGGTPGLTGIASAKMVTVGLAFTPILTTLPLDLGEPTALGKRKKIAAVTLKVSQALGLSIGSTVANATPMQDLILNNNNEPGNFTVTGLVTGMARTIIDPNWTVPGQYTIVQPNPYPASVLGVIPEIEVGDTSK